MELIFVFISIFFVTAQCKILRVGKHFTANFVIVDSHSRVMANCIKNVTNCPINKCVKECVQEKRCKTFNYHKVEHICELLNISKFDGIGLLRKRVNWVHYETDDDSSQVGPVCQAISPCKEYQICEDTFQSNPRYTCKCRDGFEGDRCQTYKGPGTSDVDPAASCHLLLKKYRSVPDGHYWIKGRNAQQHCVRRVDGGYSSWSEFGPCSKTCGDDSVRIRHRYCTNPEPKGKGGKDCSKLGHSKEIRKCKVNCAVCPPKYLISTETPIVRKRFATLGWMGKEHTIQMEVKGTNYHSGQWYNVMMVKTSVPNGDRMPCIFFNVQGDKRHVVIDDVVNGGRLRTWSPATAVNNQWVNITMIQKKVDNNFLYLVYVDGEEISRKTNTQPEDIQDAKIRLYLGHDGWEGHIRNFSMTGICDVTFH